MDFSKEANGAIQKIVSEKLPALIEAKASKMMEDIVSDLFGYGDIKRSIKEKIEKSINVNLQEFDLIDYNVLIANTINDNLIQQVNLQPILDMTQDILGFVNKKEITLQEIANMVMEVAREEDRILYEGEVTFIVKENTAHEWVEIFADVEPDQDEHECSIRFIFSTKRGTIFSFRTKEEYRDKEHKKITPSRLTSTRSLEAKIFRLYSAQVKITNYNEDIENSWYND